VRVVIDTCVWVAAVRSRRGASFALLSEIPHRRFHFGIFVPLFLEYKAKLLEIVEKAQTPLSLKQINSILSALAFYCSEVPIFYQLRPNLKDENDNMVFTCAANFGATKIITHNVKDFITGKLTAYEIEIITPGDFIRELRRRI
jgi:putative PIN family toxin of toxin-antitoxin system